MLKLYFKIFLIVHIFAHCIVACPLLDAPSNGTIDCILGGGGEPNPGEYCTFACDDGYELLGSVTRTCRDDGNWSGNSNVCTKKGTVITYINIEFC